MKDQQMLLNYLYTNFFEENQFAEVVGTTTEELLALTKAHIFPAPSYVFESKGHSRSFVAEANDEHVYRFHLRGHADWHRDIVQFDLHTEGRARKHFFNRYLQAKQMFLSSALGTELEAEMPDVAGQFGENHANSTWSHFLNGVYGVCTRDGRPESVFLKQAGVMFIEQMIANGPDKLSDSQKDLLLRAVAFLDGVESDFAPHEAPNTSRQRCIVDVRARFLNRLAA